MASEGKVVIVTGGSHGIGCEMAYYFASKGYHVAILDVNVDEGNRVASLLAEKHSETKHICEECNASLWKDQMRAFEHVYKHFGRIDIVVANAGISEGRTFMYEVEQDEPQEPNLAVMDLNLYGVIYSIKLGIHYISKNHITGSSKGTIICTSSDTGLYPAPLMPIYGSAKAAVINLVRSTAPILEKLGIQINALAPNLIATRVGHEEFYKTMSLTPMSTVIKGLNQFLETPTMTGAVAEASGNNVTLRSPVEYVDDITEKNFLAYKAISLSLDSRKGGS